MPLRPTDSAQNSANGPRWLVLIFAALFVALGSGQQARAQTTFFFDNFNRPDNLELDAATNGMSGSLMTNGTLTVSNIWLEPNDLMRSLPGDTAVTNNAVRMGGNAHTVDVFLNNNFATLMTTGSLSITLKLNGTPGPNDSTATNRFEGIGFGFNYDDGFTNTDRTLNRNADLFVAETANGCLRINDEATALRAGNGLDVVPTIVIPLGAGTTFVPGTLRLDVTFTNAAIGSKVTYAVLFDAGSTGNFTTLANRSFVFDTDYELYVGMEERSIAAVAFDDFSVSTPGAYALVYGPGPSIPLAPTNLIVSASGGNVNLSWPSKYVGWCLQVLTNNLGGNAGTNWSAIYGTEGITNVSLPVTAGNGSTFYRIAYTPSVYLKEGMRILDRINTLFYVGSNGRYVNTIDTGTLEKSGTADMWPTAYVVHALTWGAMNDHQYDYRLASLLTNLSWYVNGPGYGYTHGGQRFFDDNALIGRSILNAWSRRIQTPFILNKSLFALNYDFTNKDAQWGLPQTENNLGDGIWYTAPPLGMGNAYATYFPVTRDTNSWNIATNYWAKLNDTTMGIKKASNLLIDGSVYSNGVWNPNNVGPRASDTTALVVLGTQLYGVTGNFNYLNPSLQMANAVLNKWYQPGGGFKEVPQWGGAGVVEMLCALYETTGDVKWYDAAKDICDFLMNDCRDKRGFYPTGSDNNSFWNVVHTNNNPPQTIQVLTESAAAIALLHFAYLQQHMGSVHLENKGASGRWLEEAITVNDGTGTGKNTLAVDSTHLTTQAEWRYFPVAGQPGYYRLQSRANGYWLECTSTPDVTQGQPSPTADGDTLAVRAVDQTHTGASTMWQKVNVGNGYYYLQNQQTGYRLQATTLTDTDGATDGGWQVRAEPQTKTDDSVCFREVVQ